MARKIYLASSWRNERQPTMVRLLRDAGHEVYDFRNPAPDDHGFSWREIDEDWRCWTAEQVIAAYEHPAALRGLALDLGGMRWADTFVMLKPCGRSAALELGWAIGTGKPSAVFMVDGQEPELMVRLADKLVTTVGGLLAWLAALAPALAIDPRDTRIAQLTADRNELMAYIDDAKRAAHPERVSGEPLAEFIQRLVKEPW